MSLLLGIFSKEYKGAKSPGMPDVCESIGSAIKESPPPPKSEIKTEVKMFKAVYTKNAQGWTLYPERKDTIVPFDKEKDAKSKGFQKDTIFNKQNMNMLKKYKYLHTLTCIIIIISGCSGASEKQCDTMPDGYSFCRYYNPAGKLQKIEYSDEINKKVKALNFNLDGTINKETVLKNDEIEMEISYLRDNKMGGLIIGGRNQRNIYYNFEFDELKDNISKISMVRNNRENYFIYFDDNGNILKNNSLFYEVNINKDTVRIGEDVELSIHYPNPLWGKTLLLIEDTFDLNFKSIAPGKRKATEYNSLPIRKKIKFNRLGEHTIRFILVDLNTSEGVNEATGREYYIEKKIIVAH